MIDFSLNFGTKKRRRRTVVVMIMVVIRRFLEGFLCAIVNTGEIA